jgi:SAM-dependent methyltransferase
VSEPTAEAGTGSGGATASAGGTAVPTTSGWDEHAGWWQEHFTEGADPEYEEQIIPLALAEVDAAPTVLDLGCGEGQISRRLAAAGSSVVGIDLTASQVEEAVRRGGGPAYLRSSVTSLPFADGSFDVVLTCLVLEHVDDLDGAMAEMARVVRPGGRVLVFLNHPLLQTPDSAWIDDHVLDPPERYWRVGPYLDELAFVDQVEAGVFIRFVHRPLHRYVNTMAAAGLVITGMLEPPPPAGFLDVAPEYAESQAIPRLMVLRARRDP